MDNIIRIPVHSIIDIITNSSTEIFVHSDSSLKPAKELLQEFLKLNGIEGKADELFEFRIEYNESDIEQIIEYGECIDEKVYEQIFGKDNFKVNTYGDLDVSQEQLDEAVKSITEKLNNGEKIPEWLDDNSYHAETHLVIKSKDPKYDKFLELLEAFLYSPDWFEHQWG